MSYLAIARTAATGYERNELNEKTRTVGRNAPSPRYERNEFDERSPGLTSAEAESLKARIIAAVTVDPERFDRAAYDALWRQWDALEGAP